MLAFGANPHEEKVGKLNHEIIGDENFEGWSKTLEKPIVVVVPLTSVVAGDEIR